jgi:hypothetical protein
MLVDGSSEGQEWASLQMHPLPPGLLHDSFSVDTEL